MRILFSGRNIESNKRGGGEISGLTLLRELSKQHHIYIFSVTDSDLGRDQLNGMHLYRWKPPYFLRKRLLPHMLRMFLIEILAQKELEKLWKKINPNLFLVQEPVILSPPKNMSKTKSLVFIRGHDAGLTVPYLPWRKRIYNEFWIRLRRYRNKRIFKRVHLVLVNSKFMQKTLKRFAIKSEVVYPFIDLSLYRVTENTREFLTLVNPSSYKGFYVVLRLAEELPEKSFLLVGEPSSTLRKEIPKNLLLYGWCNDMRDIYKRSRIVLIPSVWEEPFGRVATEAQISGIPLIASKRGGLPEAVGEGGFFINDPWNISEWVKAIRRLDNPIEYHKFSERAGENAVQFSFEQTLETFKILLKEKLEIEL